MKQWFRDSWTKESDARQDTRRGRRGRRKSMLTLLSVWFLFLVKKQRRRDNVKKKRKAFFTRCWSDSEEGRDEGGEKSEGRTRECLSSTLSLNDQEIDSHTDIIAMRQRHDLISSVLFCFCFFFSFCQTKSFLPENSCLFCRLLHFLHSRPSVSLCRHLIRNRRKG